MTTKTPKGARAKLSAVPSPSADVAPLDLLIESERTPANEESISLAWDLARSMTGPATRAHFERMILTMLASARQRGVLEGVKRLSEEVQKLTSGRTPSLTPDHVASLPTMGVERSPKAIRKSARAATAKFLANTSAPVREPGECDACDGYGHIRPDGTGTVDRRERKCGNCRGTGKL
jgi:hypothetical protein